MKKNFKKIALFFSFFLLGYYIANAQYYYKDIHKTIKTNHQHQLNVKNNIQKIQIISFNQEGEAIDGFQFIKTFHQAKNSTSTRSKSPYSKKNYTYTYFNDKNKVYYILDSSSVSTHSTRIYYGISGKIDSIIYLSYSTHPPQPNPYKLDLPDTLREKHSYLYNTKGVLQKMLRFKNDHLNKTIYFKTDSLGQVFKEYEKKAVSPIYYYKHKNGKLSDIFHYSYLEKKMIPNYFFDYNEQGALTKKTVVMSDKHNYTAWHYVYNDRGEVISQKGYDKSGKLRGSLLYKYSFQP